MRYTLSSYYCVEITCAFAPDLLTALNESGIELWGVKALDELHIQIALYRKDFGLLVDIAESRGGSVKILNRKGLFWNLHKILNRPIFLLGVSIIMFLSCFLSGRILFVKVDGNEHVPAYMILENAERCGIYFGASRRTIRSEKVKNKLLSAMPQLQWVGVNTTGCVATIVVNERRTIEPKDSKYSVGKIVATRDGIIREMVVTRGNPQCKIGQAVKAGQTLVSGYTDGGIAIKAEMPIAEIYASTLRKLCVVSPTLNCERGTQTNSRTIYFLRIGKNIINFSKDSGILDSSCVKMYSEQALVLPGGFALPVALIKIKTIDFNMLPSEADNEESYLWLYDSAHEYLAQQMLSGKITDSKEEIQISDGLCVLWGRYACLEMIGQVQNEEIITGNGKRD